MNPAVSDPNKRQKRPAIYVASYCLKHSDLSELTHMSAVAIRQAVHYAKSTSTEVPFHFIISTAYETWKKGADLKKKMLIDTGIPESLISVLPAVTDSFDEGRKTAYVVKQFCTTELVIVADNYHDPRAVKIFHHNFPELNIIPFTFVTRKFEYAYEPVLLGLKTLRSGNKSLWILWNLGMGLVTDFMLWKQKRFL